MKRLTGTILTFVITCICLTSSAQNGTNHSIGFQLNPYIDADLFNGFAVKYVYAGRYSFSINDHITLGPELSGFHATVLPLKPDYKYSILNAGVFFRYTLLPESRIRPFFELSPYYSFLSYKNGPENSYPGLPTNGKDSYFSGYLAPGISLYNKSRKISLDLFCKVSNKMLVNSDKIALSYRLNFRF
jgi:hypothetical protein